MGEAATRVSHWPPAALRHAKPSGGDLGASDIWHDDSEPKSGEADAVPAKAHVGGVTLTSNRRDAALNLPRIITGIAGCCARAASGSSGYPAVEVHPPGA